MKTIIAIDPGQSGGIAILKVARILNYSRDAYVDQPLDVNAVSMPSTIKDIIDLLSNYLGDKVVYLEDVHSMPGQGVASSFKFGRGFGCLETVAMCFNFKLIYVRPQVWQKHFGLLKKDKSETDTFHKNRIKAFSQQRYPNIKVTLATADALAILEYAKEKEK